MIIQNNINKWYCEKCDFYVFNSKPNCKKCLTKNPSIPEKQTSQQYINKDYLDIYNKETKESYEKYLFEISTCKRCQSDYQQKFNRKKLNNCPIISNHNCWKY